MEKSVKDLVYRLLPGFLKKPALAVAAFLRDPKYAWLYARRFQGLRTEEIRYLIEKQYVYATGLRLNLDNPLTFNEKIQWLKLYYRDPLMVRCADKVAVREYISQVLGPEYLIPVLGIFDGLQDIDFASLPEKFVAKVNWGSGQNIICKRKAALDLKRARRQLQLWLQEKNNHYYSFFEWCYKDIPPKIIIEQYLEGAGDLPDYKFMCYNGKVQNMFIVQNREKKHSGGMTCTFFDVDFNRLPVSRLYPSSTEEVNKPEQWEEMVAAAEKLARPFPFVRVDFYLVDGAIKIGELTFYPGNGTEPFSTYEWDLKFGQMLTLPSPRTVLKNKEFCAPC